MNIEEAIDRIFENNAVLFTGSGFSFGATNQNGNPFVSASSLTKLLCHECGFDEEGVNLDEASEDYISEKGEHQLIPFLQGQFKAVEISDEHKFVGGLKWGRIYTTNYDNVLELSYSHHKKNLTPITLSDSPNNFSDKSTLCLHLNGYIDRLNYDTLHTEFKLTRSSYLTADFIYSQWSTLFRNDIGSYGSVFYVGFSANSDLDISRIIFNQPEVKDKSFFIVAKNEKENTKRRLSSLGTVLPIGLDGFVELIKARQKEYKPTPLNLKQYLCFAKVIKHEFRQKPSDEEVFNLLVEGRIDEQLIQHSLTSPEDFNYFIYRSKLNDTVKACKENKADILIHSDLGNGKTIFVEGLKFLLLDSDYDVYLFKRRFGNYNREVEDICKSNPGKTIFVVENYASNFDIIDAINVFRTSQILITTERTHTYEATIDRIEEKTKNLTLVDLNILDNDEVDKLITMLTTYGFWQSMSNYSYSQKYNYVTRDAHRSLKNILLKIIESNDIINRYGSIIDIIKNKKGFYEAFVYLLVGNNIGLNHKLDEYIYALDPKIINSSSFVNNPYVKEIINFNNNELNLKSSILSEALLHRIIDSAIIINVILNIFVRLDRQTIDYGVRRRLTSLMMFSNLQRIINTHKFENMDNVIKFYQSIKETNFCKNNPHFWLQYSIARIAEGNYPLANQYIQAAYSYAEKKPNYNTYQLDNNYARILLQTEINNGSADTCMNVLHEVQKIIIDPMTRKLVRHYPFRVAQKYGEFHDTFCSKLNKEDQAIFIRYCEQVLERMAWYENNVSNYRINRDVSLAKTILTSIIAQYKS